MNCKFCGAPMEDDSTVCAACGKENIEETQLTEKPNNKIMQIVSTVACCLLLVAMMLVVVFSGTGKAKDGKRVVSPLSDIFSVFRKNDIHCRTSFTVSPEKAAKKADDVVATIGDYTLTNSQLQVFYWIQIREYVKNNGIYDFDYTQPLAEQFYSEEQNLSWEQYFLNISIESWRRYALLNIRAEEEGIRPDQSALEAALSESVEQEAKKYDFANADAMVKSRCGSICSKDDYVYYVTLYEVALLYGEEKYDAYVPTITIEQAGAYYDQNKAAFESYGYKKEKKTLTDVRHILIRLDDNSTLSSYKVEYTDEQWRQCEEKASRVLESWREEETEEKFAELAKTYSIETNAIVGGLCADLLNGESLMVVEDDSALKGINEWLYAANRKAGEVAVIKTDYGFHLLYFSGKRVVEGDWYEIAVKQLTSEYYNGLIEDAGKKHAMKVNYKKIRLAELTAAAN